MADYDIRRELLEGLEYQRASVRSIVEGLSEEAWHTPVAPHCAAISAANRN